MLLKEDKINVVQTLCVPYVPGFSERFKKILGRLGIQVVFGRGKTLKSMLVKTKAKIPKDMQKDIVYVKKCQLCPSIYIGETSQYQKKRDQQHRSDIRLKKVSSSFFNHLKEHKSHRFDWEKTDILDREKDYSKRIVKESLYINAFKGEHLMNLEDGTPIDPIWKQFNSAIRKYTKI